MENQDPLTLRFDPQTVDHLGARMYSHLPNAIAELVANAYDADAANVNISLGDDGSIRVEDDGHGMTRAEVADRYLHIGRNRRVADSTNLTESGKRHVSGKKGLGKLALFGIGRSVDVTTSRVGSTVATRIHLNYGDMMSAEGDYRPAETVVSVDQTQHGTAVRLSDLKRTTPVDAAELAASLSKLFNYADNGFSIRVTPTLGDSIPVTRTLRLANTAAEFSWPLPESLTAADTLLVAQDVQGLIISAPKPLRHGQRGVTLYANGRLVNEPEFFGSSESSYAYSYLTGWIDVDYLDDLAADVIATDRRALDWDADYTAALRQALEKLLTRIGQEWRVRRSELKRQRRDNVLGTNTDQWVRSIKSEEGDLLRDLVDSIASDDLDISPDQQGQLLEQVKKVVPPNAEYVWRHLHPEIQDAAESYYLAADYYQAIQEAIKRYVTLSRSLAGITETDAMPIVTKAFGDNGKIQVFARFMNSGQFTEASAFNVENGQKHMSMGVVAGFRNLLAHEEIAELHRLGAFTYQDCLDGLSVISHLTRRLTDASFTPEDVVVAAQSS